MSRENYFNRMKPRRSLGGFRSSLTSLGSEGQTYPSPLKSRQQHLHDTKLHSSKVFSSSSPPPPPSSSPPPPSSPTPPQTLSPPSEAVRERTKPTAGSANRSSMSPPHSQSTMDLIATSLKCDDCQTNDGLFQCCHCNQRLCIRCCNKHYKKVTSELERLHELSDRLVAKIVHTKNDLERQKNETLEQCHKWRLDTINTINKAHTLIVQAIHDEYETLGKEYETFVQKEMAHIHIDQNELMRLKKGHLGSVLSSPTSANETTNTIETIRRRIETFAKSIDETGKFLFQVKLPLFDIDDRLRVESRFGDVTRSTSASWQNGADVSSPSLSKDASEGAAFEHHIQSTEDDDAPLSNNSNDVTNNTNDETEEQPDKHEERVSDEKKGMDELDRDPRATTPPPPPPKSETSESPLTTPPSTRYALSVENDIELQQQQFYSPSSRGDCHDSAYGTAPSSPSNPSKSQPNHYSSTSSLHEQASKTFSYPSKNDFGSFRSNRRHTHAFHSTSSRSSSPPPPPPPPPFVYQNIYNSNENEDAYRSLQHVQIEQGEDGSLEGVAIQIEQSHKTDGLVERRHTCMQACGVRRRTTHLPPRPPSASNSDRSSNDQSWLSYRTLSTPSFTQ